MFSYSTIEFIGILFIATIRSRIIGTSLGEGLLIPLMYAVLFWETVLIATPSIPGLGFIANKVNINTNKY